MNFKKLKKRCHGKYFKSMKNQQKTTKDELKHNDFYIKTNKKIG